MKRIALTAFLVFAAGAAQAQQQTNCRPTYAGQPQLGMTCDTVGAPRGPAMAPVYSWKDVKPVACGKFEKATADGNYCEAREIAAARKAVGEMIAGGDCAGALKAALATGDLAYATEVKGFCAQP